MKFATGQKTIFPRRVISSIALPQLRSFGDAWLPGQVCTSHVLKGGEGRIGSPVQVSISQTPIGE